MVNRNNPLAAAAFCILWAIAAGIAQAEADEAPALALPVDCVPGASCWIVNHFDHDPGPGAKDYACGSLVYDGHDGIDFAIQDLAVMAGGVEVRAAAPGKVIGTRDGMRDVSVKEIGADKIKDRECGNGVNVEIGSDWFVQYCHMRRGSIAVKTGDKIDVGQVLGMVGMSGQAEFPHLHLAVRKGKMKVDPFIGLTEPRNCTIGDAPLWNGETLSLLSYQPVAIYNSGFTDRKPTWDEVKQGQHHAATLPSDAGALVLWTEIFGVIAGDELAMRIIGPKGNVVRENRRTFEKTQIRRFEFFGRPGGGAWPAGKYVGEVVVLHHGADGDVEFRRTVEVVVP